MREISIAVKLSKNNSIIPSYVKPFVSACNYDDEVPVVVICDCEGLSNDISSHISKGRSEVDESKLDPYDVKMISTIINSWKNPYDWILDDETEREYEDMVGDLDSFRRNLRWVYNAMSKNEINYVIFRDLEF